MEMIFCVFFAILVGCTAKYCQTNQIRLHNTYTNVTEDGTVQVCSSGTWYAVCDYSWDCNEANAACKQLGYSRARSAIRDSRHSFGYLSSTYHYYYSCSGSASSLTHGSCAKHYRSYCGTHDQAGVRCTDDVYHGTCFHNDVRLIGGETDSEGVLQYCYNGKWSVFCYLDDEEAAVACKQLGYTKYFEFISTDESSTADYITSLFSHFSCSSSATESSLAQCTLSATVTSSTTCATSCQNPKAIKCYNGDGCVDGEVRLTDGSIAQEGRVEVCVDGVWGSICGSSWNKQAAFIICKQMGYIYSEPVIYSDSIYGSGTGPIVYYNVQCHGWEKSITECSKTNYLHFTCSSTAGVLCPDDCTNGKVRLIGGSASTEGTVEVCTDSLWGLIADAGWDKNDAQVVCRQLNLPFDGAYPVYNSRYGKPDRTIQYSYVLCDGNEANIAFCGKLSHSLNEGRKIYDEASAAGVVCEHAAPTSATSTTSRPCLSIPEGSEDVECIDGELRLEDGSGLMEYCVEGQWSLVCQLTHNETTVACRQLGYTTFTWGLLYDIESTVSSTPDASLISNISCASNEQMLSKCIINKQTDCLKYCDSLLGLHCYAPDDCTQGSVRLVDGIIEQEGRVEVCVNGVWGSVCDNGWDKTDAHVVCQQLGFSSLEPIVFGGAHFGPSSGPIMYSDVDCGGWEKDIEECIKKTHLEIQCSHKTVAGVMCSDDCSDGDVKLVGMGYYGTVEVCYGHLWGLVHENGWSLPDANVICHQLGFRKANNATTGSMFGHPNRAIHIGDVTCDGTESSIDQCMAVHYSLQEGKDMTAENRGVAGVVCYTDISAVSMISTPVSSSLSNKASDNNVSAMIIILLSLVCLLISILCILAFLYCYCKLHERRRRRIKHKHTPLVAFSRRVQSNAYDSVSSESLSIEDDTERLVTKEEMSANSGFKPSDDEADPVYEECSNIR